MLRTCPSGDKHRCCLTLNVRRMPDARDVDYVLPWPKENRRDLAIRVFLMNRHIPGGAKHYFGPKRMHFPGSSWFLKRVHADQAAFNTII